MTALPIATTRTGDDGRLLRFALRLDAAASGALGLVGLAAAPLLADLLGPPAAALRSTGAFLVVYALALVAVAARETISRPAAWAVVIGNGTWVACTVAATVAGWEALTALGVGVALAQAAAVAVFADLQWTGLRRAR
jgi:hypothetical protein